MILLLRTAPQLLHKNQSIHENWIPMWHNFEWRIICLAIDMRPDSKALLKTMFSVISTDAWMPKGDEFRKTAHIRRLNSDILKRQHFCAMNYLSLKWLIREKSIARLILHLKSDPLRNDAHYGCTIVIPSSQWYSEARSPPWYAIPFANWIISVFFTRLVVTMLLA